MIFQRATFFLLLDYAVNIAFDGISKNLKISGPGKSINQIKVGDKYSKIEELGSVMPLTYCDCEIISINKTKTYIIVEFSYKYFIDNGEYIVEYVTQIPRELYMGIKSHIDELGLSDFHYAGKLAAELPEETFNKFKTKMYSYLKQNTYTIGSGPGFIEYMIKIGKYPPDAAKYPITMNDYYFLD